MDSPNLEIGEVRMSYTGGELSGPRAEKISRLTLDHLQRLAEKDLTRLEHGVSIEHFAAPPIQVSLDAMDDEAIARTGAETIFRALLAAI